MILLVFVFFIQVRFVTEDIDRVLTSRVQAGAAEID
jgi:hypothetical protein